MRKGSLKQKVRPNPFLGGFFGLKHLGQLTVSKSWGPCEAGGRFHFTEKKEHIEKK